MDGESRMIHVSRYPSPCGTLLLGEYQERLCLCDWLDAWQDKDESECLLKLTDAHGIVEAGNACLDKAARQLDDYFCHKRNELDIPLLVTGTAFQQVVWKELMNIPYGCTFTYACIAQRTGNPLAVRAVAHAIGSNRLSLFIPCHRVTGSKGILRGYRGGVDTQRFLLQLEGTVF